MSQLPDLVADSKLETFFTSDAIVHVFYEATHRRRRDARQEHWAQTRCLGHGGSGIVWLQTCTSGKSEGELRAVKSIRKPHQATGGVDYVRELEAVAKFSNQKYEICFVKAFGWYESADALHIAMEYLPHGDLETHLRYVQSKLSVEEARQITYQILEGLNHMHTNNFAHRDIKPGNILIKSRSPDEWWIKLADFGISKRVKDGLGSSTIKGTPGFMAPELYGFVDPSDRDKAIDFQAADMWASGAVLFRMLSGEHPFPSAGALASYCNGEDAFPWNRLLLPAEDMSTDLLARLLAAAPLNRICSSDALDHPWVKDLQDLPEKAGSAVNGSLQHPTRLTGSDSMAPPSGRWPTMSEPLAKSSALLARKSRLGSVSRDRVQFAPSLISTSTLHTLGRHTDGVSSVAFSPDGTMLASGSADGTVKLWDARSGEPLRDLEADCVRAVAFSYDGVIIASGSYDCTVRLWYARSGAALQTLAGHRGAVESVAFSPDRKILASGSWDGHIRLWDFRTGAALQTLKRHTNIVGSVVFSPDGKTLASGSNDGTVKLWDPKLGTVLHTFMDRVGIVLSVAFSPDGKTLAFGSGSKTVELWDIQSAKMTHALKGHTRTVYSVAFSPNGETLASGSLDGTVVLWDTGSGAERRTLKGHADFVRSVVFSPDGKTVASGSQDTTVMMWDS